MAKTKRMAEGGLDSGEDQADDGYTSEANTNARVSKATMEDSADAGPSMTFKQAFRAARNAGDKTFSWNGKKYTTELAADKPTPKIKASSMPAGTPDPKGLTEWRAKQAGSAAPTKSGEFGPGTMFRGMKIPAMKKGGSVKKMASGGKVRGAGCEQRGKTRGRMV